MIRKGQIIACLLLAQQALSPMAFAAHNWAPQAKSGPSISQDGKGNVTEKGTDKDGNATSESWTRDGKGNVTHTKPDGESETTPPAGTNNYNGSHTTKDGDSTTTTNDKDGSYTTTKTDKDGTVTTTTGQRDARGKEMGKQITIIKPKKGHEKKIEKEFDENGNEKGKQQEFYREFMSNVWKPGPEPQKPEKKPAKKKDNDESAYSGTDNALASQSVTRLVLPNRVSENQAFTFDAQGAVEGEVIQIQTVEGEVVANRKADNAGRVFIESGILAAGIYKVMSGSGTSAKPCGQMTIQPTASNPVLQGAQSMLVKNPAPLRIGSVASIAGQGFSPNASDMSVQLGGQEATVLAATDREMKIAPIAANPGPSSMTIANRASGDSMSANVMCYSLTGKLSQEQIPSGARTMLTISVEPKELQAQVSAMIASGPVSFDGGKRQKTVAMNDGVGSLPLMSQAGSSGTFKVNFTLVAYANEFGGKTVWDNHLDGTSTMAEYDGKSHLVHEAKFDANGNCTDDTKWEYDAKGRCRKKIHIHWNGDGTVTEETKTWDEHGHQTSSTSETYKSG